MKKTLILTMLCLALGILVAGCGDDDKKDSGGGGAATTDQPADTSAGTGGTGDTGGGGKAGKVGMEGIQFVPADVTVAKGGKVTWTNNEDVPHDVTKEGGPGADFSSGKGNLQKDDTYEQTFSAAGKVEYVCTIHPNMKGTITVK